MVLKEVIGKFYTLGGCDGHERNHFNNFYFGRVWWS